MKKTLCLVLLMLSSVINAEQLVQKMNISIARVGGLENVVTFSCPNNPYCMICMQVDEASAEYLIKKDETEVGVTVSFDRFLGSISRGNIVAVDAKPIQITQQVCGIKSDCEIGFICGE